MKPVIRRLLLVGLVAMAIPLAGDAGGGGAGSGSGGGAEAKVPDPLDHVRSLLADRQWPAAQTELQALNSTGSPDWNNLMGYVARMKQPPDLAASERYYAAALAINPKHRPTLEYLGELRLQQGNLVAAEELLARLRKTTFFKSEEFKDLEKAIARYKASGNSQVAGS